MSDTNPVWSNVYVEEPSDDSVVTISSTISSVADCTVFTVNVELLFVVPDTVIKSRTAKLFNVVLVAEILYSVPVAVKLISVPVTFALCDFDAYIVVLVCAICYYLFVSMLLESCSFWT